MNVRTLIALFAIVLLAGCAGFRAERLVPCWTGFDLNLSATNGNYDDKRSLAGVESDYDYDNAFSSSERVKGDFDSVSYGTSMHFAVGQAPKECPAYSGAE